MWVLIIITQFGAETATFDQLRYCEQARDYVLAYSQRPTGDDSVECLRRSGSWRYFL